jgi:hypothetical protein
MLIAWRRNYFVAHVNRIGLACVKDFVFGQFINQQRSEEL